MRELETNMQELGTKMRELGIHTNMERRRRMKKGWKEFLLEEDGVGTVEMILIIVVLIFIVAAFKTKLSDLVDTLFKGINEKAKKI